MVHHFISAIVLFDALLDDFCCLHFQGIGSDMALQVNNSIFGVNINLIFRIVQLGIRRDRRFDQRSHLNQRHHVQPLWAFKKTRGVVA